MLEKLSEKVLKDDYFWELMSIAERNAAHAFFKLSGHQPLSEKQTIDLLRFADILSHSKEAYGRNISYKIISLLIDENKDNEYFKIFASAVLAKLGNFPALKFISDNFNYTARLPLERELEKNLKEEVQKVPYEEKIFTDSQYEIFEALKNNNHFSFSGPTSLGKSFIIESFVRYLVSQEGCKENIIILVPTRALINQVSLKLKNDLKNVTNYSILAHPTVPEFFKKSEKKFIFVFTPERLISYLAEPSNPRIDYLFVDEAQKITSTNDTRSPIYYHAILQAERKSIKLFFASPNTPNPEIFLQIFEKNIEEKLAIQDSPVAQSKFFIDLTKNESTYFLERGEQIRIQNAEEFRNFSSCLKNLGGGQQNIVYCNTIPDTIKYATDFSQTLEDKNSNEINSLIALIEEYLHKDYYLIDCLKKGIAFHFGKLPQRIRSKVEDLFRRKILNYVFCTSTLLEGVNLPAKNIFILSNAIGMSKFLPIDFWNLAGRAGRLTQELSGNIICVRAEVKGGRWENPEEDLKIIQTKKIQPIQSVLTKKKGNFFSNVEKSLKNEPFTNKQATQNQKDIWDYYANIALIHEVRKEDSILKSNLIKNRENARNVLEAETKKNVIPEKILTSSASIKAKYQNKIFQTFKNTDRLPEQIDYETVLSILKKLYDNYRWDLEESGGRDPLVKSKNVLTYYAILMNSWMSSKSVSQMIIMAIAHYEKVGEIWIVDKMEPFQRANKRHTNTIINDLMGEIENVLRFKLEKYFNNYYLLLEEKFGKSNAGSNWAEYLEYGTTDRRIIELQNIGFSRHLAKYVMKNHSDCLNYTDFGLENFDFKKLERDMTKSTDEYSEYIEYFNPLGV